MNNILTSPYVGLYTIFIQLLNAAVQYVDRKHRRNETKSELAEDKSAKGISALTFSETTSA